MLLKIMHEFTGWLKRKKNFKKEIYLLVPKYGLLKAGS